MSKLALDLINQAKEYKRTHLDLGNCGLKELPNELFDLTWLDSLSLGYSSWNESYRGNYWAEYLCENKGEYNQEIFLSERLQELTNLRTFQCNGKWGKRNRMSIHNTESLRFLTKLNTLSMGNARFNNIEFCSSLHELNTLLLFATNTKDVHPLQNLKNLSQLVLASTNVEDISSLNQLHNIECLNLQNTKVKDLSAIENLTAKLDIFVHGIINTTESYGIHVNRMKVDVSQT